MKPTAICMPEVPPSIQPARVLLIEDHVMFREHISSLINRDLGMKVCGEADNIGDGLQLVIDTNPDVVIMDLTLKGSNGLELLKDMRAQRLPAKVLVLSMHEEELYAERSLRAGALGYITKNEASSELLKAIKKVLAGETYVSTQISQRILGRVMNRGNQGPVSGMDALADRELEVFHLLGRGRNTKQIAETLRLGESTVETYRSRIKEKLGLRSSAELYLRAGQWVRENG
jgi:DNA-binding NarL/FixJ family response regulator